MTRTHHALVSAIHPHPTTTPRGDAPARNEIGKLVDPGGHYQCFKCESPETHRARHARRHTGCGHIRARELVREAGVVIRNRDDAALRGSHPLPKDRGNPVEFHGVEQRIHGSWTVGTTGLASRHLWILSVANDTKH